MCQVGLVDSLQSDRKFSNKSGNEMERQLDIQIAKLKKRLIKMCSLVDEQVNNAIAAVEGEDLDLARLVIEMEKKVDQYDVKIDKACQKIEINHVRYFYG